LNDLYLAPFDIYLPVPFIWVVVVFFGLALGSFLTCIIYRLPRGLAFTGRERSRCPSCGTILGWRELVPVFSYLFQEGKCRHCGKAIGVRYVLIELATLGFVLILAALILF
jgi:prepilin signal peptidase PulO-like enzyme (type II secretory pathway)